MFYLTNLILETIPNFFLPENQHWCPPHQRPAYRLVSHQYAAKGSLQRTIAPPAMTAAPRDRKSKSPNHMLTETLRGPMFLLKAKLTISTQNGFNAD